MYWPRGLGFLILSFLLMGASVGCSMGGRTNLDEERDPHYLEGESRESSKDAAGAAEAYHRALENDPRNASAHKKLGILYSQSLDEPDAAIYHFKKLLQLRPSDPHADVIKQHILLCKQKLAQSVAIGPLTKQTQEDLLRLTDENTRLQKLVASLNQQVNQLRAVTQTVPATSSPPVALVQPSTAVSPAQGLVGIMGSGAAETSGRNASRGSQAPPQSAATRNTTPSTASKASPPSAAIGVKGTHKVKAGDTFKSIAAQYGVSTRAIILANPNLDPKRIRPGQVLQIPEKAR